MHMMAPPENLEARRTARRQSRGQTTAAFTREQLWRSLRALWQLCVHQLHVQELLFGLEYQTRATASASVGGREGGLAEQRAAKTFVDDEAVQGGAASPGDATGCRDMVDRQGIQREGVVVLHVAGGRARAAIVAVLARRAGVHEIGVAAVGASGQ